MNNIELLILDVDGTLTDGKLYMDNKENAMKAFNVKDGFAIYEWLKLGGKIAILTGKSSEIVASRAKELGISYVIQGSKNKTKDLDIILKELNIKLENTAYMGDDINDLGVMKKVKFSACPADSAEEILKIAKFVCTKNGGNGAVREYLETIMKENGMWEKVVAKYNEQDR